MKTLQLRSDKVTSVEIWDERTGWQNYDCPLNNPGTIDDYADWCIGEDSGYWATINSAQDKIRLNGWYIIDGVDYYEDKE